MHSLARRAPKFKSSDLFSVTLAPWENGSEARDRTEAQIIEVGRRHLITDGAAGLSLRAVAREIGLVSSAVYRYVASRDDLLTLLLVDAYTELADTVDAAAESVSGDWAARLVVMAHAARRWAVDQPARWALLYGSPVPGYRAPAELTVGPGTRVVGRPVRGHRRRYPCRCRAGPERCCTEAGVGGF